MKRLFIAVIFGLCIGGCTTQKNIVWVHRDPRNSEQDFKRDNYECTQQSRTSYGGGGTGSVGIAMIVIARHKAEDQANQLYKMCMEARGYVASDQDQYHQELRKAHQSNQEEWLKQSAEESRKTDEWMAEQRKEKERAIQWQALGITGFFINPDASTPVIWKVHPGSPADKQGMKVGDIIIEKNGQKITSVGDFRACSEVRVGEWVEYKVLRGKEELTFKIQPVYIKDLPD